MVVFLCCAKIYFYENPFDISKLVPKLLDLESVCVCLCLEVFFISSCGWFT